MFGDTIDLAVGAGTVTLNKINQDGYSAEYFVRAADGLSEWKLAIRHSKTKATTSRPVYDRHNVEVIQTVYATTEVEEYTRKTYIVMEQLPSDDDETVPDSVGDFIVAAGNLTKLVGWQS